mmetsp:Transcript_4517/g.17168  ORF Transcript_4517/g.17168 Transcript_4517/m.17168 type:complete len:226 (+) Transcript_4517:477-1154(+)
MSRSSRSSGMETNRANAHSHCFAFSQALIAALNAGAAPPQPLPRPPEVWRKCVEEEDEVACNLCKKPLNKVKAASHCDPFSQAEIVAVSKMSSAPAPELRASTSTLAASAQRLARPRPLTTIVSSFGVRSNPRLLSSSKARRASSGEASSLLSTSNQARFAPTPCASHKPPTGGPCGGLEVRWAGAAAAPGKSLQLRPALAPPAAASEPFGGCQASEPNRPIVPS